MSWLLSSKRLSMIQRSGYCEPHGPREGEEPAGEHKNCNRCKLPRCVSRTAGATGPPTCLAQACYRRHSIDDCILRTGCGCITPMHASFACTSVAICMHPGTLSVARPLTAGNGRQCMHALWGTRAAKKPVVAHAKTIYQSCPKSGLSEMGRLLGHGHVCPIDSPSNTHLRCRTCARL